MEKDALQVLLEGFMLGLSTGGYCLVSCLPFLMPYVMMSRKWSIFISFIAGRFIAYLAFATAASFIGIILEGFKKVSWGLLAAASLLMIIFSLFHISPKNPLCKSWIESGRLYSFPFLAGILLGFNLCPPFIAGMAKLIELGSVLKGLIFFTSFFVATTIYLFPMVLPFPFIRGDFIRRVGVYLGILAGAWFLIQGLTGLLS